MEWEQHWSYMEPLIGNLRAVRSGGTMDASEPHQPGTVPTGFSGFAGVAHIPIPECTEQRRYHQRRICINGAITWENRRSHIGGTARAIGGGVGQSRRENSISTCGCEDADARLDECCLWGWGAVMFRRTSDKKKTRCPGGQKCGCQINRGVDRKGGAPKMRAHVAEEPDYCTSTRRLRSRMYFPSLYFWDCSYALSYFQPSMVPHLQQ